MCINKNIYKKITTTIYIIVHKTKKCFFGKVEIAQQSYGNAPWFESGHRRRKSVLYRRQKKLYTAN